jgi:hypothetical protein
MPFFKRESYLNTKLLYEQLKSGSIKLNSTNLIHESEYMMVWELENILILYWAKANIFVVRLNEDNSMCNGINQIIDIEDSISPNKYYHKTLELIKESCIKSFKNNG